MRTTRLRRLGIAARRRSRPQLEALEGRELLTGGVTDLNLDFGTATSPVGAGWVRVAPQEYSASRGFGWSVLTPVLAVDRGGADPVLRDFHLGLIGSFRVDVAPGTYDVTATLGDRSDVRDRVSVTVEGQTIASNVRTRAGESAQVSGRVTVTDGQLTVRLTDGGGSNPFFAIDALTIHRVGLTASAGPDQTGVEGSPVTFRGTAGGTGPLSTTWNFGDGSTATGMLNPQHVYRDNGTYAVALTVADGTGATTTARANVTVTNVAPTATAGGPYQAVAGQAITLSGSATDPSPADTAAGLTYTWDFGDGTPTQSGPNLTRPTHAYADLNTYTVRLTVADKDSGRGSASATVAVSTRLSDDDPLSKPVLNQSNFTYVGSFRMPLTANGWSTAFSTGGLTHRYVDGQLRFLTTSHVYSGGLVYETNYPGISLNGPYPQAQVVRNWGDVYTGEKWVGNDGGGSGLSGGVTTYGLNYDQERNRLYWNYGHWYNTTNPYNPSLGYSTLDDATGVATGVGAWSLADRPEKFDRGGTLRIPQWFADRYTGGKTLGVGFGGYFSIISSGSLGPSLAAIADPDPAVNSDRSALANVPLIGYPIDAPDRAHRDPDYTSYYDGGVYPTTPGNWNPSGGTGYWTWCDEIYGGATWIDAPQLGGVLYIARVGRGNVWYEGSTLHADRGAFEWLVYDPKDLAEVASGVKQQWQVQPKYAWTDDTLPLGPLDQSGWSGDGTSQVGGVTFDSTTDRLYVLVNSVWPDGREWYPQVYVYQLQGGDAQAGAAQTSSASFVRTDTSTQGNWNGNYGAEGYTLAGDAASLPASATVGIAGQSSYTWAGSTADLRAPKRATTGATDRVAATWYTPASMTFDLNLADGRTHQLALYALDWDRLARTQTVEVTDAATGDLLDARDLASFDGGTYLVWRVKGHVRLRVTNTGPANAVVSGVFLG